MKQAKRRFTVALNYPWTCEIPASALLDSFQNPDAYLLRHLLGPCLGRQGKEQRQQEGTPAGQEFGAPRRFQTMAPGVERFATTAKEV